MFCLFFCVKFRYNRKYLFLGVIFIKELLLEIFENSKRPLSFEKVFKRMENEVEKEELKNLISKLEEDFSIIKTSKGEYVSINKTVYRKGKYVVDNDGKVQVKVIEKDKLFKNQDKLVKYDVLEKSKNKAIDGDVVLVKIVSDNKSFVKTVEIKKVLSRDLDKIVGEVYKSGKNYYVKAIDKKKKNIIVKLDDYEVEGIIVSVDLEKQLGDCEYSGKVIKRLNHKFDPSEEMLIEAYRVGIDDEFSKESLLEVKDIPNEVLDIDKINREDLTKEEIFTIDGADTKDIDDALSFKILDNGNYLVGVHIADVSNYVRDNSSLDKDAYKRGTSVYLLNTVIPMLPRQLSNGICSLNPDVERLALSCLMEVSPLGEVVNHRITRSVIKSNKKMTYEEVNKILNDENYDKTYEKFVPTLKRLNKLALILKRNRLASGALDIANKEIKLIMKEDGQVEKISKYNDGMGENLIEEFMVLANETVHKHLVDDGYNCLNRVHELPIAAKMEDFFSLMRVLGYEYKNYSYLECCNSYECMADLQEHINSNNKLSSILSSHLIRCMSKARYSPEDLGHYGLAKDYYCHFTSPIRRYPDLIVHRLLKLDMQNENDEELDLKLAEIGEQSSKMERAAQIAEREVTKMKIAEYLENYIGNEYNGLITGIDENGLVVQLDNLVEGRVSINSLPHYKYKKDLFSFVSLEGAESYTIGDYLRLKLVESSKEKKLIKFDIVEKIDSILDTKKNIKKIK